MAHRKGAPRTKGSGRRKGSTNKHTAALKDMILSALTKAGGVRYLTARAKDSPGAFLSLLGRVLPMTLTGPDGGALEVRVAGAKAELDAALTGLADRLRST